MTADAREPMKPCPFCGSVAEMHARFEDCVNCTNPKCDAAGYYVGSRTWNRRAPDANVKALVKAARAYAKHETVYYRWKLEEVLAAFPEEQ